jgi:glycosyltransferase involved in cell wall biosynthesis/GT2 family glycosyltransferase
MDADDTTGFGVNLIAYIRAEMGLGTAARGVAHALEAAEIPFNILNFEHSNPALHRDKSWKRKEAAKSAYDFTLFAVNPDNLANARARVQRKFVQDRYSIGYWFWELPEIPDNWQASFPLVDEVWAASHFVQDAISLKSPVPVFRVPVPIQLGPTDGFSRRSFSLPEGRFLFLTMGDTHSHIERKNPVGVIRAFKNAFPRNDERVGLVLKINNPNSIDSDEEAMDLIRDEIEGQSNIYLVESDMTRPQIDSLLAASDCFVSLHRSEGFGLGPAEAMSLGKPVILTKWSGNTDYMTPTNSIGIDYRLVPVGKQLGPYEPDQLWADPDLEQASSWMNRLVEEPQLARRVGHLGQETIQKDFSPAAVGAIIRSRLTALHGTGLIRRKRRANANDPTALVQLKSFATREGGPDPQRSASADVTPGQWCRLRIDLPWGLGDGSAPFRFDPVDRPGIVDLAGVTLRRSATSQILWRANTRAGLNELTIGGTALLLSHPRLLRLLSFDEDPQVYLPHLTGDFFEEPLILEVLVRFDRAPASIEHAVSSWNQQASQANDGSPTAVSRALPAISSPQFPESHSNDQITMAVYSAGEAGYSEDRCTYVRYASDQWSHLDIALQLGLGLQPLRLDPLTAIGLIDVAALTIKSALNDEVLWEANGGGGLETLHVSGSAVRIPHPHLARVLSYGEDPQIYLPAFPRGKFDGPLRLEAWLKTETGLDSIRRSISELATLSAQARAATSQTRGLLEESNRAFSDKQAEIEALRVELREGATERETLSRARAAVEEEKSALKKALEEVRTQLAAAKDETGKNHRELESARAEVGLAATQLEKSRLELKGKIAEAKRRGAEIARFREDLQTRVAQGEQLAHELSLLSKQLVVEHAAKVRLMEEFSRTGERVRTLKQDLALMREEPPRNPNFIQTFLGVSIAPKRPEIRDAGTQEQVSPPQYKFWLDSPAGPSARGEKTFFAGWVLPPPEEKVLGVRALVQGEISVGQYGFPRSDVAAAFSDSADSAYPGFSIGISLEDGIHEVALQALASTGRWHTFYIHQHEVLGEPAPRQDLLDPKAEALDGEKNPFRGALENPAPETHLDHGLLLVSGWLHFEAAILQELSARLGNGSKTKLTYSLPRPDVAKHLGNIPSAANAGFEGYIPLSLDFSGPISLKVEAILKDGTRMVCFEREVLVLLSESPLTALPEIEWPHEERYAGWIQTNTLTPYLLKTMKEDGARLASVGPKISVIVPTFNTPAVYLEELIASVRTQLYPNWQLCVADDASTEPHVRSILERAAAADSRIKVVFRDANGHIAQASNSALALAEGDYVGLLDHDDLLSPDALLHVAEAVAADHSLDVLYTDEDKLSPEGDRYDPMFKGSYSPEMSLTHNYIQHFTVIRTSLVQEVEGFRKGLEGAQDLDLYLRVLDRVEPLRVKHIPFVCYHWRAHSESTALRGGQKTYVFESARESIADNLKRLHIRATPCLPEWARMGNCCLYQLKWSDQLLKENPVSIIIPTKNRGDLLKRCLGSLEQTVDAASVNVIIVDDFSTEEATLTYLKGLESSARLRCRVIRPRSQSATFNFSQLINEGVAAATTPLVLLLNNDTEALARGWLEEMVGWMSIDGVAVVGAKLLYPDRTIQHAGVVLGPHGGLADHLFHRLPENTIGFNFLTHAARNVSAVTAACMLTSKAAFDEMGGFDQDAFGMEYNDVDFCLRLAAARKRIVFTPQAKLLHHCGQSRGEGWRPAEHLNFLRRYPNIKDPYYNENLDLDRPVTVDPDHFLHKSRVGALKVLMISHNLNLEGAPKVLFDHATYFATHGGYDITIVSRQDGPLRESIENAGIALKIIEDALPLAGESRAAYTERLREVGAELEAEAFDLIVCNTLISFWGVILSGLFDVPVIWHIHESTALDRFFPFDSMPEGLVENCLALADRVVFEASATRRLFAPYKEQENFTTIRGSIDVEKIEEFCEKHTQHSLKLKHGIPSHKLVVTLIGTTCARKGQLVFVEAIDLIQTKWPDLISNLCFIMLGARESAYLNLLREKMETIRGTDTRLIEETHDVFDFYRLSDILICASFQESFPRVILEGMAFKLPIVSTDVFGIPEMIANHGEGFLVHPGDPLHLARCIENLARSPEARRELGAKAHAKVTRLFNSRTQLSRQLDLTKEVVARHV